MNRARVSSNGRRALLAFAVVVAVTLILAAAPQVAGQLARTGWTVVAWNNLGMHCMDADFSVFAILPPYNTIQAQVLDSGGRLVKSDAGVRVVYQGVADAAGSLNTTSSGKTNFWSFTLPLFGVSLPVNVGLANANGTYNMPGSGNVAQSMRFDPGFNWFIAEGIPITPYDDAGRKNYYPMMKVTALDAAGVALASTNIVLPVSDEMDCRACHSSGSGAAAKPAAGWVYDADAQRDYRFNILRLHDDRQLGRSLYASALAAKGYSAAGLYATAASGTSILCAQCHRSEALPGSGIKGIPPLTSAIHTLHAGVTDPTTGSTLGSSDNRGACYRCHPGSETRCLRGAMGNSIALTVDQKTNVYVPATAIQCQNCHGSMSAVGAATRIGWLQEPTCQGCHTGTATSYAGAIRLTTVVDPPPTVNATFATNPNTPAAGFSLYRFSSGHGGLQCSSCHGSTHAEYPSSHQNDNVQSVALQGHGGTIAECGTCHTAGVPLTGSGGPHGMHPVGPWWVDKHHDYINGNLAQCQACHGADYRGTVLSRAFASRTFTSELGTRQVFRGAQVGCYMCHSGPFSSNATSNRPPIASNLSASATSPTPVSIPLAATDPDGNALALRIVSQPANGAVAMSTLDPTKAIYRPNVGWAGTDTFTYAAWDGSIDSNLATVTVSVKAAPCTLSANAQVPATALAGTNAGFAASASTGGNCAGIVAYDWDFGDNTPHSLYQNSQHSYASAGTYTWTLTAALGGVASRVTGSIAVSSATCTVTAAATVPAAGTVGTAVPFTSSASTSGCSGGVSYDWDFGDGTAHATTQNPTHTYAAAATYTWRLQATASGVVSVRTGNILVSAMPASPPAISGFKQLSDPFRVEVDGSNFQAAVRVYIGGDATAWSNVTRLSAGQLILGGSSLKAMFPRNQPVTIRVANPDGQSATGSFTRK